MKSYLNRYVETWLAMLCAMVGVLTFGFYRPWWDFSFIIYSTKRSVIKQNRRIYETK
jgi:hypothetical protein